MLVEDISACDTELKTYQPKARCLSRILHQAMPGMNEAEWVALVIPE